LGDMLSMRSESPDTRPTTATNEALAAFRFSPVDNIATKDTRMPEAIEQLCCYMDAFR